MVLYLNEFKNYHLPYGMAMSKYSQLTGDKVFHELPAQEIVKMMVQHGAQTLYRYKSAINCYLKWLTENYKINTSDLYFELNHIDLSDYVEFIGFYNFKDLNDSLYESEVTAEANSEVLSDRNALYTVFYLQWLGIMPPDTITIRLTDVTEFGHRVYIPSLDKTLAIDNDVIANFIWNYKNTEGIIANPHDKKIRLYTQDTLCRTTRNNDFKIKSIYSQRSNFILATGDKRFSKNHIFYSGCYDRMWQTEKRLNRQLGVSDTNIISEIFGRTEMNVSNTTVIMREYRKYKQGRLSIEE